MGLFVGHDLGTGSDKAVLVDDAGRLLASHRVGYAVDDPGRGRVEQDPETWWRAVCEATRAVTDGVDPRDVHGLAFAGQMLSLVPMDARGRPTREAISWMDHRASAQARRICRRFGGERVLRWVAGGSPTGKDLVAKVAWIREEEPSVHAATAAYGDATSFLVARATGRLAMDPTAAGATGLYHARKRRWSRLLAGLARYPLDRTPPVVPSTDVAGRLTARAAVEIGLPEGLPVAMGMADIPAAAVGSGAVGPGEGHLYLGTSSWIGVAVDRPASEPSVGIASVPSAARRGSLLIAESETAGACRDWFEREVGPLDRVAEQAPPGCDGLLFLPWLYGERSPVPDPALRGGWVGLSMEHGRAHLARAVLEGVALNLRWILEAVDGAGPRRPGLRAIGGGVESDAWLQALTDVTGERIERVENPRAAGAVGAALVAGVAVGALPDVATAGRLIRAADVFEPTPGATRGYDTAYRTFRELAPALRRAARRRS
ncbi:MAG: xylulokinase [Myxococcota bacterium]